MAKPSRFDWSFRPHMPDEDRPLSAELRFAEALAELPAIERSALALSELGGLGAEDIAQRLGTDTAVVRKLLARARETVRATIAVRGRRSLTALIPFQSWWSSGSAGPAVRTAGAVAAAVIGTSVAIGGAAADPPRPPLVSPDPPTLRAIDRPQEGRGGRVATAGPASAAPARGRQAAASVGPPAAPDAPARRAGEPEIGAPAAPAPAAHPVLPASPTGAPPLPPPPLPFPTPYPLPDPAALPPVDPPVETPPAPAPPTLPSPPLP